MALDNAAIVGVYVTEQKRKLPKSPLEYEIEAVQGALNDAGIDIAEVDGIGGNWRGGGSSRCASTYWAEILNHPLVFHTDTDGAASSHLPILLNSASAVGDGLANVVVYVFGGGGGGRPPAVETRGITATAVTDRVAGMGLMHGQWDASWGSLVMSWFALLVRRHMHDFGTTSEQLAKVSVAARAWASMNPEAIMRNPITVDDVLGSRMIADPLHLLDCCLVNDGYAAVVVTNKARARSCRKKPVRILGGSGGFSYFGYGDFNHDVHWTPLRLAGKRTFDMTGLRHDDIDIMGCYDATSFSVIRVLEELGFCKLGEGGAFVSDGKLAPGGSLPMNTHGGGLSCSHAFSGLYGLIDIVRQMRGECGQRQVPNVKIGLAHADGGPLAQHTLLAVAKD